MLLLMLAAAPLLLTGCVPEAGVGKGTVKSPQATAPALKPSAPAAPATAQATSPVTPATPQIQALIDAVEVAYQSGVANYHAGKLQTAKADFDRAVDLMLSSNFDLRNEAQLRDEFDRVIDAVNTLEMEALKQGNGFAPKIEPAPVDILQLASLTARGGDWTPFFKGRDVYRINHIISQGKNHMRMFF